MSRTVNTSRMAMASTSIRLRKDSCCCLIQAAVLDRARRNGFVQAQFLLDIGHGAAQVAAFQARGDRHILPQVFAVQFQLAGRFLEESATCESLTDVPSGVRKGSSRRFANRSICVRIDQDPDGDDTITLQHRRSRVPSMAVLTAAARSLAVSPKRSISAYLGRRLRLGPA